jgi:hypothetical protein
VLDTINLERKGCRPRRGPGQARQHRAIASPRAKLPVSEFHISLRSERVGLGGDRGRIEDEGSVSGRKIKRILTDEA